MVDGQDLHPGYGNWEMDPGTQGNATREGN